MCRAPLQSCIIKIGDPGTSDLNHEEKTLENDRLEDDGFFPFA